MRLYLTFIEPYPNEILFIMFKMFTYFCYNEIVLYVSETYAFVSYTNDKFFYLTHISSAQKVSSSPQVNTKETYFLHEVYLSQICIYSFMYFLCHHP